MKKTSLFEIVGENKIFYAAKVKLKKEPEFATLIRLKWNVNI
jgi:hypothetical protein